MTKKYQLKTLEETKLLAKKIAAIADRNLYLLLNGELAVGKTQLTKFIATELGVKTVVSSPTFVILNQYDTKYDWKLIHIDAYRLNKSTDFTEYYELTVDNFNVVEWANNLKWDFSRNKTITIDFQVKAEKREIAVTTSNLEPNEEEILFDIKKSA